MTDDSPAPARYPDWVNFAFAHIFEAVDTAIDEVQRDADFLTEDDPKVPSPEGDDRQECIREAVARFVAEVMTAQEA